jgi:multisubunit Na+/H+ antiporter MnhE subunit
MIGILLRVAALTGLYLLIVSSTKPGDVATGVVLAALVVAVGAVIAGPRPRPRRARRCAGSRGSRP